MHARATLQRLFTMFPAGPPGAALALLRVAVATSTILAYPDVSPWLRAPGILIVLALVLGTLTPIFTALSLALQWISWGTVGGCPTTRLLASLVTVAVLLLGPGAYSFDARRFGRKLVTFPPEKRPSDD